MLIINHTTKHRDSLGNETFTDHYQLAETHDEARQIVTGIISRTGDSLHCYAISQILEASEPHWTDPEPILTTAEREKDAEANDC